MYKVGFVATSAWRKAVTYMATVMATLAPTFLIRVVQLVESSVGTYPTK